MGIAIGNTLFAFNFIMDIKFILGMIIISFLNQFIIFLPFLSSQFLKMC